jgi:PIN domain nuclease of toxin-antitoxin system
VERDAVTLLLDTHVVLWWLFDSPELPALFRARLDRALRAGESVAVSAISFWEIAKLTERGRLELELALDELLEFVESHPSVRILPLTARIASESTRLGRTFPKDPADQLIAATARCHELRLLTADEAIRRSNAVALA